MKAHAVKKFGKYKAAIKYPAEVSYAAGGRTEFLGTKYRLSEDGRNAVVAKGAPLYDTREEALAIAQANIDWRIAERARYLEQMSIRRARHDKQRMGITP